MARIGKFFFFDGSENLATVFYYHVRSNGGVVESIGCVDNTSSFLEQSSFLLSPSGYKEDTVYTQKPIGATGNLTFTRGSDAWRTNVQGLVERTPWNFFTYSDQFDNVSWSKNGLSITPNSTVAPDGTITADLLDEGTLNTQHWIFQNPTFNFNTTYTISVYAKYVSRQYISINIYNGVSSNYIFYDIQNGSIIGSTGDVTATITSVGNGWYRITYTRTISSSGSPNMRIAMSDTVGNVFYTGTNKQVYLWGAQLVEGAFPLEYFPTTDRLDVPRIDYSYGTCPALLLEPQRTNNILRSEEFENAYWAKQSGATVTANTATSPDGTQDADTINLVSGSTISRVERAGIAYLASTSYTLSFYFKNIALTSGQTFAIRMEGSGGFDLVGTIALFNNTNTVVLSGTAGSGFVSSSQRATYDILANGWVRCSIGLTTGTNAGTATVYIISNVDANRSFYAYGAQLEVGAYATSYIKTEATTVTRLADSFSRNNIYTNNLITSAGGTWYVELRNNIGYTRDANVPPLFISDVSGGDAGANMFGIGNVGFVSSLLYIYKRIGGVYTQLSATTTSTVKIAIKWNGSTADVFVNGIKTVSATTFTTTQMQFLNCNGGDVPKYIQGMALYPVPLDDVDCELLTNPTSSGYSSFASMASSLGYILI